MLLLLLRSSSMSMRRRRSRALIAVFSILGDRIRRNNRHTVAVGNNIDAIHTGRRFENIGGHCRKRYFAVGTRFRHTAVGRRCHCDRGQIDRRTFGERRRRRRSQFAAASRRLIGSRRRWRGHGDRRRRGHGDWRRRRSWSFGWRRRSRGFGWRWWRSGRKSDRRRTIRRWAVSRRAVSRRAVSLRTIRRRS